MIWPFERIYVPRQPTMELAWAAGIAEGEGTFGCNLNQGRKTCYFRFGLQMTDKDVIEEFARIFEHLNLKISEYPPRISGRKPIFNLNASQSSSIKIAGDLWFRLCIRRRQQIIISLIEVEETRVFSGLEELSLNGS